MTSYIMVMYPPSLLGLAGSGLLVLIGGAPSTFSLRMSGIVASFAGGDLLRGEFLI